MSTRILCVEDNPQNMRLVRKILCGAGYEVIEAPDATSGIELARHYKPELVLMDVNLPDMDGLEATKLMKSDLEITDLPVIALTANVMHGDRERCLAAGCSGYIPKPITKSELLNTVAHFVKLPEQKEI